MQEVGGSNPSSSTRSLKSSSSSVARAAGGKPCESEVQFLPGRPFYPSVALHDHGGRCNSMLCWGASGRGPNPSRRMYQPERRQTCRRFFLSKRIILDIFLLVSYYRLCNQRPRVRISINPVQAHTCGFGDHFFYYQARTMAKTKVQKEESLKQLTDSFANMKSVVFANFDAVGVKSADALRKACRDEGVDVVVAKKTLLKKAVSATKVEGDYNFDGGVASFFSMTDEVAGPRIVKQFGKDHEGLKMLGGIVDKEYYDSAQMMKLASLPSKDELLAKAVGSMAAPISGFVGVLSGTMRQMVGVLAAIKDTK